MNNHVYQNGRIAGAIVKATANLLSKIRIKVLVFAGNSRIKVVIANTEFVSIIFIVLILMAIAFYKIAGLIGVGIIVLLTLLLSSSYSTPVEEVEYDFNNCYREGPEGHDYHSGC